MIFNPPTDRKGNANHDVLSSVRGSAWRSAMSTTRSCCSMGVYWGVCPLLELRPKS